MAADALTSEPVKGVRGVCRTAVVCAEATASFLLSQKAKRHGLLPAFIIRSVAETSLEKALLVAATAF